MVDIAQRLTENIKFTDNYGTGTFLIGSAV